MKSFSLIQSGPALRKERKPSRGDGQVRLQDALKFEQRFVVEADRGQIPYRNAALLQAVLDRSGGKPGIALDPGKPLLLGGGDNVAIPQQASSAVVIEGRKA